MQTYRLVIIAIMLFCALPHKSGFAADISGTYIGSAEDSAYLMQIVKKANGELQGHYREASLNKSGKFTENTAAVTGASDGNVVVITVKIGGVLGYSLEMSGNIRGKELRLTGGSGSNMLSLNLERSDEAEFNKQRAKLEEVALWTWRQNAVNDVSKEIYDFNQIMKEFIGKVDRQLPMFQPVEDSMRQITRNMQAALAKELKITGLARQYRHRSNVSVWINQVAIEGLNLHRNFAGTYAQVQSEVQTIRSKLKTYTEVCRPEDFISDVRLQTAELTQACELMQQTLNEYETKERQINQAFSRTGNLLISEEQKQDEIARKSDAAAE